MLSRLVRRWLSHPNDPVTPPLITHRRMAVDFAPIRLDEPPPPVNRLPPVADEEPNELLMFDAVPLLFEAHTNIGPGSGWSFDSGNTQPSDRVSMTTELELPPPLPEQATDKWKWPAVPTPVKVRPRMQTVAAFCHEFASA